MNHFSKLILSFQCTVYININISWYSKIFVFSKIIYFLQIIFFLIYVKNRVQIKYLVINCVLTFITARNIWSSWSSWSECSCRFGGSFRERICDGKTLSDNCVGYSVETKLCENLKCSSCCGELQLILPNYDPTDKNIPQTTRSIFFYQTEQKSNGKPIYKGKNDLRVSEISGCPGSELPIINFREKWNA
jgi:hypothetical protein